MAEITPEQATEEQVRSAAVETPAPAGHAERAIRRRCPGAVRRDPVAGGALVPVEIVAGDAPGLERRLGEPEGLEDVPAIRVSSGSPAAPPTRGRAPGSSCSSSVSLAPMAPVRERDEDARDRSPLRSAGSWV